MTTKVSGQDELVVREEDDAGHIAEADATEVENNSLQTSATEPLPVAAGVGVTQPASATGKGTPVVKGVSDFANRCSYDKVPEEDSAKRKSGLNYR